MTSTIPIDKGWLSKKLDDIERFLSDSLISSSQSELVPFANEIVASLLISLVGSKSCMLLSVPAEYVRSTRKSLEQVGFFSTLLLGLVYKPRNSVYATSLARVYTRSSL